MPIDGWIPGENAINFDTLTDKKDGTTALYGTGETTGEEPETPEEEPQTIEATDEDNAITALIEIGLDMVDGVCKDLKYPKTNRTIWENHGKSALNKAVNTLCPAGSGCGNAINSPWVGLIVGIGCLFMCLYPIISYRMKLHEKQDSEQQTAPEENQKQPEKKAAAAEQIIKLPGGGDEAQPDISMSELIRRNLESGGEPAEI